MTLVAPDQEDSARAGPADAAGARLSPGSRRAQALVIGAMILLVLISGGGGGRDPLAALAWQLCAVGLVAGMAVLTLPRGGSLLRRALGALAVVLVASSWQADRAEASVEQALAWLLALVPALALVVGGQWLRSPRDQEGCFAPLAEHALLAGSAAFLIVQAAGVLGSPLLGTAGGVESGRPLGTFFDPNHLAACLCLVAAIHAPRAGLGGMARMHLLLAGVAATAALATTSRVAVLSVGGLLVAEGWRRRRISGMPWPRHARPLAVLVMLAFISAGSWVAWNRRGDPEAWTRTRIWQGAAPAMLERPLLGLGPAGFQSEWPRFQQPVMRGLTRNTRIARTPHGEWLRLPIELGAIGLVVIAGVIVLVVRQGSGRTWRVLPLLASSAPILLVHDAFHAPAFVAWFSLGLALPLLETGRIRPGLEEPRRLGPAALLGLLLLALTCARVQVSQWLLERAIATGDPVPLQRSLRLEPQDVEALLLASDMATRAGALGRLRALALAEEAARLAPRDAKAARDVARHLAVLRRAGGDTQPGLIIDAYQRACHLAPHDASCAAEAAAVLASAGAPARALEFARAGLHVEPHFARARAWAIVALEELGRPEEAAAEREILRRDLDAQRGSPLPENDRVLAIEPELLGAAGLRDR